MAWDCSLKESVVSISNFSLLFTQPCIEEKGKKKKNSNAEQSTDAKERQGRVGRRVKKPKKVQKHTTAGIRWWSPTQLLICRSEAYVWQSGRDAQLSSVYGRM